MTLNTLSIEDIKTGFPHPTLTKCVGPPSYDYLRNIQDELIRNCTSVESTLGTGQDGLAGLAEFPNDYLLRTGRHFNCPGNPGNHPVYPAFPTQQQRDDIKNRFDTATKNYVTCQRTETICLTMLQNAIDEIYLGEIFTRTHGFGGRNLIDILQHLYRVYGEISADDITQNQTKLTNPVNPALPVIHIFKQIEDCSKFANAAGVAFTPAQLLKAAEQLVIHTGKYQQCYREFLQLPEIQRTYTELKRCIIEENCIQVKLNLTARAAGFANATTNGIPPNTDKEPTEADLTSAVQHFAEANAAETQAFNTLTSTNQSLHEHRTHDTSPSTLKFFI